MISKIKDALAKKNVGAWQILETRRKSFQSFLAKTDRECARIVETTNYEVTVHVKKTVDGKPMLGVSSFKLSLGDEAALERLLDNALFSAKLVSNPAFELPEQPAALPDVELRDKSLSEKTLEEFETRLLAAVANEKNTRLSAAEFFIDQSESRLVSHKGLDVSQEGSFLHSEFILLSSDGKKENEFIDRYSRRFKSDFDLEAEVAESARFAREATLASLPKTGAFPIVLSEEPLDHLFNPLVAKSSARMKFNKMIEANLGDSVVADGEVRGDSISLWSNPLLKGAVGSYRFDSYGTPGSRVNLISKNKLIHHLADKRYADYLNLPATGALGNVEVEPGTVAFKDLLDPTRWKSDRIYHLVAFSAFEPNSITGAFSAEIRAGYEITAKGVKPIKGGSVSGVLQEALLACHLAKERTQREAVFVPQGILFENLTIAGTDE